MIRPPPEMLAGHDNLLPAFNLGPDLDEWFTCHEVASNHIVRYLQAYIWANDHSNFVRLLGRGPAKLVQRDAEYLYSLFCRWFMDPQ